MAIQMRQGNEVDFDAEKMLPGEWAVSKDARIVRMCFAPGVVVRMATYEAFEADMVKIEAILKNVQDIQTAVKLVQVEINGKSELVAENASMAEEYMLKAKEYAEQAGAFTGMQIAKRDLLGVVKGGDMAVEDDGALRNFKRGAGNTFAVSDTVESPFSAYKLYGKSVQDGVPTPDNPQPIVSVGEKLAMGKNLFGFGITTEDVTEELRVNVKQRVNITKIDENTLKCNFVGGSYAEGYIALNGIDGSKSYTLSYKLTENTTDYEYAPIIKIDEAKSTENRLVLVIKGNNEANIPSPSDYFVLSNIQLEEGTEATAYEPYTGGKKAAFDVGIGNDICGKNLFDCSGLGVKTNNGATFTPVYNEHGKLLYVEVSGNTSDKFADYYLKTGTAWELQSGKYIFSGCPVGGGSGSSNAYSMIAYHKGKPYFDVGSGTAELDIENGDDWYVLIRVSASTSIATNLRFYPMIRLASVEDDTYSPYTNQSHTLNRVLRAIPVTDPTLANYTDESGQMWCADTIEEVNGKTCLVERVNRANLKDLPISAWYAENNYFANSGIKSSINAGYCTHFKNGKYTDYNGGEYYFGISTTRICISNYGFTSLDEFKAFIAENDVYCDYILATPIITELTAEEIEAIESLHSYNGVTTVMSDAWAEVECATSNVAAYVMSNKKEIEAVVNDLGTADISAIGDGTVKGAVLRNLQAAHYNGLLNDALMINPTDSKSDLHKPYFVDAGGGTSNMPSDCAWGVREVYFINNNMVTVKITGISTDGVTPNVWMNTFNMDGWKGWSSNLPLTGGTLSGDLTIQKFNNGRALFQKSHSETVDYGAYMCDFDSSGKEANINVRACANDIKNMVRFTYDKKDGNAKSYNLFGEHNKPTGSYTGNGSATERVIQTGGIGNLIVILNNTTGGMILATPYGAFGATHGMTHPEFYTNDKFTFNSGVLTIKTSDGLLNGSGHSYTYHII